MLHMIHRSSGKGDCLSKWQTCFAKTLDPKNQKGLRKFTVYFTIDCCSLWIDQIIQNIKQIQKTTAKSRFIVIDVPNKGMFI